MAMTKIAIDRATIEPWIAVAQSSRLLADILSQIGEPLSGSNFEEMNAHYPPERSSDWCREFLTAGIEHMTLWADHVAPLRFHEEAHVTHTFRPVQTLSRAAIESSSQAVWMMNGESARECARRHVCLLLDDLEEQRKAALGDERKKRLKLARQIVLDRLEPFIGEKDIGRFPGYMNIVKEAAATVAAKGSGDADLVDAEVVERLWRASAGSAHGKRWPSLELQIVNPGKEIAPGLFETDRAPDPVAITKILNLANSVVTYGVLRFADYSGYEPQLAEIIDAAQKKLAAVIPRRSDL
ncbi:hypothetical protein [Pseudarthrobacter sp. AB1]|uniref:hypothetical protein n=1 Tax=Pseudarthrobacter sp. AB1 TaxID=2138309 RepID=UPI00186B6278|nr:hypothetical protein [Pseudarthrobacter sp. AB1]